MSSRAQDEATARASKAIATVMRERDASCRTPEAEPRSDAPSGFRIASPAHMTARLTPAATAIQAASLTPIDTVGRTNRRMNSQIPSRRPQHDGQSPVPHGRPSRPDRDCPLESENRIDKQQDGGGENQGPKRAQHPRPRVFLGAACERGPRQMYEPQIEGCAHAPKQR